VEEQESANLSVEGGVDSPATHPMADLLETESCRSAPRRGENVDGCIVSISPNEILIDVGCKTEGVVSAQDLERLEPAFRDSLKVGDIVSVYVLRPQDREGNILLSLSKAQLEGDWKEAERKFQSGEIIEEAIIGANRGGLIINLDRVRGFIPASQIVSAHVAREATDEEREKALAQLVGTKLRLKVIELDRQRNRLILSERAAVREWRQGQKDRLLDELREGHVRKGLVSSLCDFGAFIDLGGADGLVHLSELSWRRVGHPKQVLEVGQEVEVFVLSVDKDKRRIALSIKRLQQEPWSRVDEKFTIGQLVNGTITKLTNFGAFARLDDNIEGLIHISEISEERIAHPKDVLHEGQEVQLRVIRIDPERQRIGLSLRRVNEEQYPDDYNWDAVGNDLAGVEDEPETATR
jgi:small subunit ribosomal protein S1